MKLYLINPRFPVTFTGNDYALRMVGRRYASPSLSLLTIAGLTPREFELEFCDENTSAIQWKSTADVIALTGMHMQKSRLIEIARRFRALGKRIVVGGPSVTVKPEWYRPVADVLVRGEAEYIWPRCLRDLAAGLPQSEYHETGQVDLRDSPAPRYDLIKPRAYLSVGIQATRGCPFTCEFCDIIVMYGRTPRAKSIDQVVGEVERLLSMGVERISFVDDNFIGNRRYAFALLEAIRHFVRGVRKRPVFFCQATINVANHPALLRLMHEVGMRQMFIGIETPRVSSLTEVRKYQNVRTDLLRDIETVQSHGIVVLIGSIVGFDHDDSGIFDEQVEFITRSRVTSIMPNQLYALPGTPLHERMRREGRLLGDEWNTDGMFIQSNFVPKQLTPEELNAGFTSMFLRLYAPTAFAERLLGELERLDRMPPVRHVALVKRPLMWLAFGWVWLWFLVDHDRRALLRVFWRVVPWVWARHPRVADVALMKLVVYRHAYRMTQAWDHGRRRRLLEPVQIHNDVPGVALTVQHPAMARRANVAA